MIKHETQNRYFISRYPFQVMDVLNPLNKHNTQRVIMLYYLLIDLRLKALKWFYPIFGN
jgi:hypothetical protein